MSSSERSTEVGEWSSTLMNSAKPCPGRVAIDNEDLVEVRHLKHKACREGTLERREGHRFLIVPHERVSPQETYKWSHNEAKVLDELSIIPREAEKAAEVTGGLRRWPCANHDDLLGIHGHAASRDDMAQVGHRQGPK